MRKRPLFQNKLVVKKSPTHGFGVFAGKNFKAGELIEECYFIISDGGDEILEDFYFEARDRYAILTGFGVIYNHSDEPNVDYNLNMKTKIATIVADEPIKKGEEIFVSYGEDWFGSRDKKMKDTRKKKKKKTKADTKKVKKKTAKKKKAKTKKAKTKKK